MRNPDIRGYENWDFQSSETDARLVVVSGNCSVYPAIFQPVSTQIVQQNIPSVIKSSGLLLAYFVHMIKSEGKFETALNLWKVEMQLTLR